MSCEEIVAIIAIVVSACGILISAVVYLHTVNREKKILTIKEFSRIREKYPNVSPDNVSDDVRLEYLKEIERFCVGIHHKIYDIQIIADMSGHFLVKQYDSHMEEFMLSRRKSESETWKYKRYEETIRIIKNIIIH